MKRTRAAGVTRRGCGQLAVTAALVTVLTAGGAVAASRPAPAAATAMDTKSDIALLVDYATGSVLFEKNADKVFPPASLTKMMTMIVTFREITEGRLSLDTEFTVSEHAWRTGGAPSRTSSMFAPINSNVKVSDLIQGVMVQSANDGALTLAEGIAGSEANFAELMNREAKEIGLENTTFANPTGLPDPPNRSTARDLYRIGRHIIATYPDFYKIFSQKEFTYNKIRQLNRNPLLNDNIGADGMKTGYIKESGYNLVGSAVQNGQRLIVVIGGAPTEKDRGEDARKLLDWGFRTFETVQLYKAGEAIGEASVFGGTATGVKVAATVDVDLLVPRGNRDRLKGQITYSGPLRAPVEKGAPIGRLVVTRNDQVVREFDVTAAETVARGSIGRRAVDGTRELLLGLFRR